MWSASSELVEKIAVEVEVLPMRSKELFQTTHNMT